MVKIGMMSFAHLHADSYAAAVQQTPNAKLVGVADDDAERGRKVADRYVMSFFNSYADLLRQDIDAVIICSENVRHKEMTVMAAEAGKHVLCEKPLAPSIEDCKDMIRACKEHGVKLQTAFPCHFSPAKIQAKQAIEAGKLGEILAIKGTNHGKCPGGWFIDKDLAGGGAVMDHTVHVVDLMRWVLGSEISEVYAEIGNRMFGQDFDDIGMLTFEFQDGTFATLDISWSRSKSFPTWGDVTMFITGTKGVLSLDLFNQKIDVYSDSSSGCAWDFWGSNIDYGLVSAFVNSIDQDLPIVTTGDDGLAATEAVMAAYRSFELGEPVKL